jgi:hypothetical protein
VLRREGVPPLNAGGASRLGVLGPGRCPSAADEKACGRAAVA